MVRVLGSANMMAAAQLLQGVIKRKGGGKGGGKAALKVGGKGGGKRGSVGHQGPIKPLIRAPFKPLIKGGGKGGKRGNANAGGSWMFVPAALPFRQNFLKGGGKGKVGAKGKVGTKGKVGAKASGKGKVVNKTIKSKFSQKVMRGDPKTKEKLAKVEHELKVWVGGLATETSAGRLRKHFAEASCKPHLLNLTGKDRACISFKTEDDAQAAISALAATELDGSTIEVDVWTKPVYEKKEKKAA